MSSSDCVFCLRSAGEELWSDRRCRIIWPREPEHPGLCRVVWLEHVREMTDLSARDRNHLMRVVFVLEHVLRDLLSPNKINLASLGNLVPHIHWHVIPRYTGDAYFPGSIWSDKRREWTATIPENFSALLRSRLAAHLSG